jgi:hypothetical protein
MRDSTSSARTLGPLANNGSARLAAPQRLRVGRTRKAAFSCSFRTTTSLAAQCYMPC